MSGYLADQSCTISVNTQETVHDTVIVQAKRRQHHAVVKVGRNGPERRSTCSPNSGEAFRLLVLDGNAAERLIIGSFKSRLKSSQL